METIEEIGRDIVQYKTEGEPLLEYTREEIIDKFLDLLIELNKELGVINNLYQKLFEPLDSISSLEIKNDADFEAIGDVISELQNFNYKASKYFAILSKISEIQNGCKTALSDLRINIRTMREYLEDIEERFLLGEDGSDLEELVADLI